MAKNRLYYRVKPYLPWSLRMALRRMMAGNRRRLSADVWPIKQTAARPPEGWSGWPDGKQFAFVLTHDVEGCLGLEKCRQLMQLEQAAGFHSSFNFVPEGAYRLSREQREELLQNGFEVGVHDLRHDGKLYWSKEDFSRNASRINHYLAEWGASGFRSGFMLHNLDWLHELDVVYDASTFDTDPFEPQPDGADTIFPFWVPGERGNGYVELPYTLPQDSTLFLVLKERTIDIWKRKLDWVAQHGGMALLTVHPDYINFNGQPRNDEYSHELYKELLGYVARKYQGKFWHANANEVAKWYRDSIRSDGRPNAGAANVGGLRGKKAAVVLYSYYPSDPRPCRAAEALANAGMELDLICLRQSSTEPAVETINGVNVKRLPLSRRREGKLTYVMQYGSFIGLCALLLGWRSLRKKYDLVHVHNMPDILVFSALVPKMRGARVILDLHDPMPELMRSIFGLQEDSRGVRMLKWLEKLSVGFADRVITVNLTCKKIFASRGCRPAKIQVVMNSPDEKIFGAAAVQDANRGGTKKPFVVMYHGSIVERHGLDLAVRALVIARQKVPQAELRIYGARTAFLDSVMDAVQKEGLTEVARYLGPKNLKEIVAAIDECDVGIIPNRRSVFTELNTPTRIFEYLARSKPVIAPKAPGIQDYFGPDDLLYFELGDAEGMARMIEYAFFHAEEVRSIVKRGEQVYYAHVWSREKLEFVSSVTELLNGRQQNNDELRLQSAHADLVGAAQNATGQANNVNETGSRS